VKRGAGLSGEVIDYQTIMYEGYGPGGVAILIECLTDNRNRAAAEVRTIMSRNHGQMADPGSVAYNFSRKGVISITKTDAVTEDDVLMAVLDAGAEEVVDRGGGFEVITDPANLVATRQAVQANNIDYDAAEVEFIATVKISPERDVVEKVFGLVDALDDSDDVQNVFTNMEPSPEILALLDTSDS
jgi:YebC/PmpR family DNA-binding regulatory protein